MRIAKVLAVLAAILLVGSVAVGTLGPPDMTLGECIRAIDSMRLPAMEHYVRRHLSGWIWEHPLMALLVRPVWLLPTALGLICAGASATFASRPDPSTTRRRRS